VRARIATFFGLLSVLLAAITVSAILFLSEVRMKLRFLERVEDYVFEVQEARRHEKNYFLYGTNLPDAMANVQTAQSYLERSAEQMTRVVGERRYRSMRDSLDRYGGLLEQLLEQDEGPAAERPDLRRIEVELRTHGARIVADAQDMIDGERLELHTGLVNSHAAALVFLVILTVLIAYGAFFIIRSILRPLKRFMDYTARIGAGDYSPILPARKYRDEFSRLAVAFNQMLDEIRMRQDQLMQTGKMAAVGNLTSGIAHELNNPLNNIGLTAEALLDGFEELSEAQKCRMLEQISTQVERASGTVRNLLDFTRKQPPLLTSVSIGAILERTLRLVGNELSLASVDLDLEIEDELPKVKGNSRNLEQVFLNLALNSIQAMPRGGRLIVRARRDGSDVRIDVSDTGVGIPPEVLDQIFEPFFTTKEPGEGTGLGLSVTHGIIERHGGRIVVSSTPGKGATFSVYLPLESKPTAVEANP